ncbi:odorant receptor 10a-like isoform X5 [Augochlora pura]
MNMSLDAPEHADYKWAVTLNRYPLRLLGLWPPENNREESFLEKLRAPVIFVLMQIFLIFPLGCMLLLRSQGLMMYLENFGYFIPCMISVLKFVIMYRHKTTTAFCYLGFDAFYGTVILHITAQLENLQARLVSINSSDHFHYDLTNIVIDHIRLSSAVDVVENTYMLLLLVLLVYFGVFNCVYIFEIVFALTDKSHSDSAGIYYQITAYINTLAQMTLYCIAGQLLTTQSEGMFFAAYECNWTNLEPNKAKNLIFIMVRAKKTFYLTAGKLFPINMPTLCNILKISLSYISLLLAKV